MMHVVHDILKFVEQNECGEFNSINFGYPYNAYLIFKLLNTNFWRDKIKIPCTVPHSARYPASKKSSALNSGNFYHDLHQEPSS